VKTLLSLSHHHAAGQTELPLVVAEIFDSGKLLVTRKAYRGPIEVLASDAIISRLITLNMRHPGLSHVYGELLSHGHGNETYIRDLPMAEGRAIRDIAGAFPNAIVLGVVRPCESSFEPLLNPPADFRIGETDRIVLMARHYANTSPDALPAAALPAAAAPAATAVGTRAHAGSHSRRRVLVLGWSHKAPALIREFHAYPGESFDIDVVSVVPATKRSAILQRQITASFQNSDRVSARQIEADYVMRGDLERIDVASYDSIVFLGSDWLASAEESDARTILGYLLLREHLPPEKQARVLVELLDPGNVPLLRPYPAEVIVTPLILSHMLAQVALRRELRSVFDELFGPGGAEIEFRCPEEFGLVGAEVSFRDVELAVSAAGGTAIGVRTAGSELRGGVHLNPPRNRKWSLQSEDSVIVLSTQR
jgi:hypothetical protein